MAADDDKNETPDPWADLVADDLAGGSLDAGNEEISFSFVDDAESPADPLADADPPLDAIAAASLEPDASADSSSEPQDTLPAADIPVNDEDVGAWLTAVDGDPADASEGGDAAAPPLSVFAPEEAVAEEATADQISQSSIEIGTGFSGIDATGGELGSQAEAETEDLGGWEGVDSESSTEGEQADAFAAAVDADEAGFAIDDGAADAAETEEPSVSFEAAAPAAAAAVAPRRVAAAKPRAKAGGLGPMIGVVAGGVLAIPITMAILLWGFQRDPFGIAKQVPESLAFLLPQKFQPGFKKRAVPPAGMPAAPSLDDLAASEPDTAATDTTALATDTVDEADEPTTDPVVPEADLAAVDPLAPATEPVPSPDATEPESEPADPLFPDPDSPAPATPDPLAADASAAPEPAPASEPAPPALPPLDTSALEAAVAEAATALEAAAAVEDHSGIAGKKLLVDWYKAVARVADQLVTLHNEAADTGRPLEERPECITRLHEGIDGHEALAAALPTLARSWLAYARRDSEGILVPVTFDSAKKVGPYWRSKVRLEDGEHVRDLAIITREEPEAVAGDRLLITGIVFDGDVIWAADVRTPATEPATVDF